MPPRHAVQTPGESNQSPIPDQAQTAQVAATSGAELQAVALQTGQEGDREPTEVERLRDMVEAQSAQIANLMGAVQNMARSTHGNGAKPGQADGGLPDASDVDAQSCTSPVLTKQGWIVPPDYGMSAEARAEREERTLIRQTLKASIAKKG